MKEGNEHSWCGVSVVFQQTVGTGFQLTSKKKLQLVYTTKKRKKEKNVRKDRS